MRDHAGQNGSRSSAEQLVAAPEVRRTCNRSSRQKLQRSHSALLVGEAGLEVGVRGKVDRREGDVSQEAGFRTLHRQRCELPPKTPDR